MTDSERTTRRMFLKTAGAAAAGLALTAGPIGCARPEIGYRPKRRGITVAPPPGQKLRLAFIGVSGMGGSHLNETKDLGVVCPCYCDVDTGRMKRAAEMYPQAKAYQDYREMFDKEHKNFDAVMIGIPDHHHYPATMIALQHGKHVYTQKPLTHTVWEARQLAEMAAKTPVATQMGNQGHALEGWRLVYEWINSGALGDIVEVHNWTDRPVGYWKQGMERPEGADAVPANLNWDVWLGPAPTQPYKEGAYHSFVWRGWWDFGCGALGDMACHTMDGMFWALDPGAPISAEPFAATPITADAFPNASVIKWKFARKGRRKAFTAYWYDGGLKPQHPAALEYGRKLPGTGNLFIGTKSSMLIAGSYGNSPRIIPESKMKEIGKPPRMLDRSPGHYKEWIMAARGEKPIDFPKSNFAYAGPMTEAILLGNVALHVGRRIDWDSKNLSVTNVPEANQYINKEYREGWKF